jgi:hypothetical protein
MTRYTPLWQQGGSYPALGDRALLDALFPTSCSRGATPTIVASSMNVSVAPGTAAVALSASGGLTELCRWDAAEVVTLAAAPPSGQSRVDLIVVQVRDNALDSGGNNDFLVTNVTGTPSGGTPAAPAVPADAYCICQVTVPGGVANLNTATLLDRRFGDEQIGSTVKARAYRAAPMNTVVGTARLPFDTISYDSMGGRAVSGYYGFDPSQGIYICPVAGDYLVTAQAICTVGAGSSTEWLSLYLRKNGATAVEGFAMVGQYASQGIGASATDVIPCAQADVLDVAHSSATGGNPLTVGATTTFVSIRLLS